MEESLPGRRRDVAFQCCQASVGVGARSKAFTSLTLAKQADTDKDGFAIYFVFVAYTIRYLRLINRISVGFGS